MFTTEQLSEMFRMGTLNGTPIERGNMTRTHNMRAQFDKMPVYVNNKQYIITRIFPFNENKTPKIIVYYEITQL